MRIVRRAFKGRFGFIFGDAPHRAGTGPKRTPDAVLRSWIETP